MDDAARPGCPLPGVLEGDADRLELAGHGSSSDSTEWPLNDVLQRSKRKDPL